MSIPIHPFKSSWAPEHYGPEDNAAAPIQGNDVDVWIENPAGTNVPNGDIGQKILLGSFNSIVITIRMSTEPYQTFRQRIAMLLDGDIQIAFVLERGWVDTAVHVQTFGFKRLGRQFRVGRSPRYLITLNVDSRGELPTEFQEWYLSKKVAKRVTDGIIQLYRCKMDSLHLAISSGKQVGVNQWQGLAEGMDTMGITPPAQTAQPVYGLGGTQPGGNDFIVDEDVNPSILSLGG